MKSTGNNQRRRPGRKRRVIPEEVFGRSKNYITILSQPGVWFSLLPIIETGDEAAVRTALERVPDGARLAGDEARLIEAVRDVDFPKINVASQIRFVAESAAGRSVSARRSRDICEEQRGVEKRKSRHHIRRIEFYIECSCGYEGPSRDCKCQKCGAEVDWFNYFGFNRL